MVVSLNILVVEDNDELREATVHVLQDEGHRVTGVDCAEAVPERIGTVDLMLVDLNLPGEDGLALAARLRRTQPDIGLIMMTARRLPEDKKRGYDSGADIYLTKPISFEELSAAVAALARRIRPDRPAAGLRLHTGRLVLLGGDQVEVPVSSHEATLLAALMRAAEHRLESWQLIELLSKDELHNPKAALELQILRLRKKLQQAGAPHPSIQSIRGWGYQLCAPIQLAGA